MVSSTEVIEIIVLSASFLLSYFGVEKFRHWSLRRKIIDFPNERSSHVSPTPRGGGLIFVVISLGFYALSGLLQSKVFHWSYLLGGVLIALVSWLDDLFSVRTLHRFIVHGFAAFLVIYENGYWQEITLPSFGTFDFGVFGAILTFCWIVGLTNAYNFMDGADGIAASQALTAGAGWLIVGKLLGSGETALFAGVIAFSCLGFFIHNREPAKIFMGDVGSAFLGYTFAVLPILAKVENPSNINRDAIFPFVGILLVWFFVFDSSFTFAVRLLKRRKVWQAHREHLYQRMIIKGYGHMTVTIIYSIGSLVLLIFSVVAAVEGNRYLIYALTVALVLSILLIILGRGNKSFNRSMPAE